MVQKILPTLFEESVLGNALDRVHKQYFDARKNILRQKRTQSLYRENDAQTIPWEAAYTIKPGHDPEVLTVTYLVWENGLPAGLHEIEIINRMRMRRAWEAILPPMDSPANINFRNQIIAGLERDKWTFRESEIEFMNALRIELAEQLREIHEVELRNKKERRFEMLNEVLTSRKEQEKRKIKSSYNREMRKLASKYRGPPRKIRKGRGEIVKYHMERHTNFVDMRERYDCFHTLQTNIIKDFVRKPNLEEICPDWLDKPPRVPNYSKPKLCRERMCLREKKREERKLTLLNRNLESIKAIMEESQNFSLLVHKEKPVTPSESSESEFSESQRSSFVSFIDAQGGEGESVAEVGEEPPESELFFDFEKELETLRQKRVDEIMQVLEGKTIVKQLNYLNENLNRLQREREAHAVALLAEKKRVAKEIIRTNREQLELHRRREIDEIFREITKINQESAETYLEDIMKESLEWVAEKNAEKYIEEMADKIDEMEDYIKKHGDTIDEDGIIANLVYKFVLPEVERELERERAEMRKKATYLAAFKAARDTILNLSPEDLRRADFPENFDPCHKPEESDTNGDSSVKSSLVDQPDTQVVDQTQEKIPNVAPLDSKSTGISESKEKPGKTATKSTVVDEEGEESKEAEEPDSVEGSEEQTEKEDQLEEEEVETEVSSCSETIRSENERNDYLYLVESLLEYPGLTDMEDKKKLCKVYKRLMGVGTENSSDCR